jgi:hypothetical protein
MIVKLCIIVINDNAIYCLNLEIKSILSKLHSLWIKRSMHWLIGPEETNYQLDLIFGVLTPLSAISW